MVVLEAKQWALRLGDRQLMAPIDWTLSQGEVLGIIGESGSGKTLLTRALLGEFPVGAECMGKLCWGDVDMATFTKDQWQAIRGTKIGYMAQNPMAVFNQYQTIESHAYEFLCSHGIKSRGEVRLRMMQCLTDCNLDNPKDLLNRYPFELSGGMLQRCMMALLLALDTKVLICDEPTSALDDYNTGVMIDCLHKVKDKGISMIIVTHDYRLMQALADSILILQHGNLVEYGPKAEILTNPKSVYGKKLLCPPVRERFHQDPQCFVKTSGEEEGQ